MWSDLIPIVSFLVCSWQSLHSPFDLDPLQLLFILLVVAIVVLNYIAIGRPNSPDQRFKRRVKGVIRRLASRTRRRPTR
jgi:hypothetical protein